MGLSAGDQNITPLSTPTDSQSLAQDWLYPDADFLAGNIIVTWTNPNPTTDASANVNVWYNGIQYFVASLVFTHGQAGNRVPASASGTARRHHSRRRPQLPQLDRRLRCGSLPDRH